MCRVIANLLRKGWQSMLGFGWDSNSPLTERIQHVTKHTRETWLNALERSRHRRMHLKMICECGLDLHNSV